MPALSGVSPRATEFNCVTSSMAIMTGEKASGNFLIEQARLVATDVKGTVIEGSGHWLMEEATQQVIPQLLAFIDAVTVAVGGRIRPIRRAQGDAQASTRKDG